MLLNKDDIENIFLNFPKGNRKEEVEEEFDMDDLMKKRIESQKASARSLYSEYDIRMKDENLRKLMRSFPRKSMFLVGESGIGKSSLIEYWVKLCKIYGRSSYSLTEKSLMDDYFYNDYGNEKTDTQKMLNIFRFEYIFMDEFFNNKNWERKNALHVVGDFIELAYETIKKEKRSKIIFSSNHAIEKFISEKSIIRKFNDLIN